MKVRHLRLLAAMFVCAAMTMFTPSMAQAVTILDQDVEQTATGWAGWTGNVGPPTYAGLLNLAVDDDAGIGGAGDQLPLEALNGNVPYANNGTQQTLTLVGFSDVGTYNVTMQVVNWDNAGMPTISATLAGLFPSSTGANLNPASGDDEIWTYQFDVTAGNEGQPFVLTLGVTDGIDPLPTAYNYGVDHIVIEGPALVPPTPPFMPPAGSVPVGNDLTPRDAPTDGSAGVFYTNYVPMPGEGTVGSVGIYSQGTVGATFEVLQLRPTGTADEYEVVYNSGPNTTDGTTDEVAHFEFANGPTNVLAGDIFAHHGMGIAFSSAPTGLNANNAHPIFFPTATVPGLGTILTLSDTDGSPGVPVRIDLPRDYSMAVNFEPIPEPSSIILIIIGLCSLGFWKMKK